MSVAEKACERSLKPHATASRRNSRDAAQTPAAPTSKATVSRPGASRRQRTGPEDPVADHGGTASRKKNRKSVRKPETGRPDRKLCEPGRARERRRHERSRRRVEAARRPPGGGWYRSPRSLAPVPRRAPQVAGDGTEPAVRPAALGALRRRSEPPDPWRQRQREEEHRPGTERERGREGLDHPVAEHCPGSRRPGLPAPLLGLPPRARDRIGRGNDASERRMVRPGGDLPRRNAPGLLAGPPPALENRRLRAHHREVVTDLRGLGLRCAAAS